MTDETWRAAKPARIMVPAKFAGQGFVRPIFAPARNSVAHDCVEFLTAMLRRRPVNGRIAKRISRYTIAEKEAALAEIGYVCDWRTAYVGVGYGIDPFARACLDVAAGDVITVTPTSGATNIWKIQRGAQVFQYELEDLHHLTIDFDSTKP